MAESDPTPLRWIKNNWMPLRDRLIRPGLRRRFGDRDKLCFYFLSTGRVGTRFFSRALGTATNATVYHQPGPDLRHTLVREAVSLYRRNPDAFRAMRLSDHARLETKILKQLADPRPVYGDTLNHMFPFGCMLHGYLGAERLRLVHLVRDPVTCGRSILKSERDDDPKLPGRFADLRPPTFLEGDTAAEKTTTIWNGVNGMIADQFDWIDDSRVCKRVRLEDTSVELVHELFAFLGLEGFERGWIEDLLGDTSSAVRHSHVSQPANQRREPSKAELELIAARCRPLAERFGYEAPVVNGGPSSSSP